MAHSQVAPSGAASAYPFATLALSAIGMLLLMAARALADDPGASKASGSAGAPAAQPFFIDQSALDQLAFVGEKLAEWKVVLGGGVKVAPKYEGSDEFELSPVPFVSAAYGDWLTMDSRGARVGLYAANGFQLSARLGYDTGRQQDESDHLRGLGDIGWGAVIGARAAYQTGPFEIFAEVDRVVGGSEGLQAKFGADAGFRFDRFRLTLGASATWADETYMQAYFGVTPLQSALSGLPVYTPEAGIKRVDLTAGLTYMLTDKWLIRGQAGLGYLVGDAGDSPIVQTRTQPFGMLLVGYKF